jgi:CheY-like chemotaxis protein
MRSRVLVVDDDAKMCELIQEVLHTVDIESLTLTASGEAVPHLVREKFDAIFLDVRMPSPDGLELTRKIRATGLNLTTPIIVITGDDDRALLGRAFSAGASFFLFKPVERQDILRLVRVTQGSIEQERRRFRRVKVKCKVSIESGSLRLTGSTLDLSIGGTCVQASPGLPLGAPAQVNLEMKSGPPLALPARVLRVFGEDCMGMQFENLGAPQSKALQEFLLPLILAKTE